MSFQIPRKKPPNRAPTKRDAPFPEPSNYLLQFPVIGLHRFPNGPPWRKTSVSRTFFYTFPSVPGKKAPHPCSLTGSLWRENLHLQSQRFSHSFIHSFISVRVPNTGSSHKKTGKIFGHRPLSPTWTEGLRLIINENCNFIYPSIRTGSLLRQVSVTSTKMTRVSVEEKMLICQSDTALILFRGQRMHI
jgi:hypothetical protein